MNSTVWLFLPCDARMVVPWPHPIAFLRDRLNAMGIIPWNGLKNVKSGARVTVAGLVMIRQRPGSAKGVMFITLEDEGDIANLII
jgi:error-prone DNA polymerase